MDVRSMALASRYLRGDTVVASAFRRALGVVSELVGEYERYERPSEYERLMKNRWGACDRHGKRGGRAR